jgi:hypothetical protein
MGTLSGSILGVWVGIAIGVGAGDAPLRPVALRCESADAPCGVDAAKPRLSWALEGGARGARQTAWQIRAASGAEALATGRGDLWDSGRVASDETAHLPYGGTPPASSQSVFWKVRIWDEAGRMSAWSAPSSWVSGILRPGDWLAQWITAPETPRGGLPLFRKAFDVAKPVTHAVVHVCGLGHHEFLINGRKIGGDRFLDPAWTVYERTLHYATHDITRDLRPGANVFGVMLGKGFYNTKDDRRVHRVNTARPLKLILQARIEFADGTVQTLVSDGSWRQAPGPITHSAILGGEDFDAGRMPAGWDAPGFDDRGWAPAVETAGTGGRLAAAVAPPMRTAQEIAPIRIDEPEPGVFVYDFGQNASAIPRLRVRGAAGQAVRLIPAEQRKGMSPRRNDGRGLVDQGGVGRPNHFEYTLRGGESETWMPRFSYTGFQYLQVEGAVPPGRPNPRGLPVVEDLASVHVRNAAPAAGSFECSNPLFNRIETNIDWAVRSNFAHVLTDCPHREKLGWLEVAYLMGPSMAARHDLGRFYAKICGDIRDSQETNGCIYTVAPNYPALHGGFRYTPEWGAAGVVIPWQLHEWYGDRRALEENFDAMRRFVEYMRDTSRELVPVAGLGDWYDYGHGKGSGPARFTPPELTAMATFHRCARIVSDSADVLGRPADRKTFGDLADRIRDAFNRRFLGPDGYTNRGSPQAAHAMALVCGLAPEDRRGALLDAVVRDLRGRGKQQTAGDIAFPYLLEALAAGGCSDVIFDIASRRDLGGYGYIVDAGWTALPEAWDANTGVSMNHCMLGHLQGWFTGRLAGLRPDRIGPGFRRFMIDPCPVGDVTWARTTFESIRGRIECAWSIANGAFVLDMAVPPNTTATVSLSAAAADAVREGAVRAERAPGVRLVSAAPPGRVCFEVGGGRYRFVTPWMPATTRD